MSIEKALDFLTCPKCKGELQYSKKDQLLICIKDKSTFVIKNDIIILLGDDIQYNLGSVQK